MKYKIYKDISLILMIIFFTIGLNLTISNKLDTDISELKSLELELTTHKELISKYNDSDEDIVLSLENILSTNTEVNFVEKILDWNEDKEVVNIRAEISGSSLEIISSLRNLEKLDEDLVLEEINAIRENEDLLVCTLTVKVV